MQLADPIIHMAKNFHDLREDFPLLHQTVHGRPLIYLDSSSTSQKPQVVIDALNHYYSYDNANVHRGVYELSERATKAYEATRDEVKNFIHAAAREEIIFVHGTTEGINLIAQTYGRSKLVAGDEIIISAMEHHSNIVPWQLLSDAIGTRLRIIPINDKGELDLIAYQKLFNSRTKLVSIAHASNVLGTINPIKEMITIAHAHRVPVVVDGAQAAPHIPVDVQELDCDFYVFSGHKMYGPTGVGAVYGKRAHLEAMPPYQGGGSMISQVSFAKTFYNKIPHKFEAGTPNIAGVVGWGAALRYLQKIGMNNIAAHEQALLRYATAALEKIPGVRILGTAANKVGVISFVIEGIHPHDIATVLDNEGIAIRAGHHCAMPLMEYFKVPATARASFGLYNTQADVDALVTAIAQVKKVFA